MSSNDNAGSIIISYFEQQVAQHPHQVAIVEQHVCYTYAQVNNKVNQLSYYLRELGVGPEVCVGVAIERSADFLLAMLAILKAGGAYIPLDAQQPASRLQYILEQSACPLLITHTRNASTFDYYAGKIILLNWDEHQVACQSQANPVLAAKPNDLAYIIFTSGTTGKPKGVQIEQHNVVNYANWFAQIANARAGARIDFANNPIFDMAVTSSLVALMLGFEIVICNAAIKKDARKYLQFLQTQAIHIIKVTPSYFKLMGKELSASISLPALQTVVLGGEPLATADCARWLAQFPHCQLINEYGPTEATVAACAFTVTKDNVATLDLQVPIGKPGLNMQVELASDGELFIGGAGIARGYLQQPQLTQDKFFVTGLRYYKTGDICRFLPSGDLVFLGRNDEQVKIRGYRVEPAEIANILNQHAGVSKAIVIPYEQERGMKQIVAYYVPQHHEISVSNLRTYLTERLPEYMVPAAFVCIASLPLTANDKLDKRALPHPFAEQSIAPLPVTPVEQLTADIWREELGIASIAFDANFFALGGHSLSAARIISRLEHATGKKLYLQDIYRSQTITELAKVIAIAAPLTKHSIPDTRTNRIPLSDFQSMLWLANLYAAKATKLNVIAYKRFAGRIDPAALSFACEQLVNKQEALAYYWYRLQPLQYKRANLSVDLQVMDLTAFSADCQEKYLLKALNDLTAHYPWQRAKYNLIVKLYLLSTQSSEIQICLPHIIADDYSTEVVFKLLSYYYQAYAEPALMQHAPLIKPFKKYIHYEGRHLNRNLARDSAFWESYLADASLIAFPSQYVIANMHAMQLNYSSYFALADHDLQQLRKACAQHNLNLAYALCAAVALALTSAVNEVKGQQALFFNVVKSARDDAAYDNTIGCFLKLDAFKLKVDEHADLFTYAHLIQREITVNEPYQHCSGLLKIACLARQPTKKLAFISGLFRMLINGYKKIFPTLKLNSQLLSRFGSLFVLGKKNEFLININVWNNFFIQSDKTYFNLRQQKQSPYHYDLSVVDNVIDICFMRAHLDRAYVVISANLHPDFREQLGQAMLAALKVTS
jgi:amino acid adenylation domain-containing protein